MIYNNSPLTLQDQLNRSFSHKFIIPKQFKKDFSSEIYKLSHTLLVIKLLLEPLKQNNITAEFIRLANSYNIPLEEMGLTQTRLKALQ